MPSSHDTNDVTIDQSYRRFQRMDPEGRSFVGRWVLFPFRFHVPLYDLAYNYPSLLYRERLSNKQHIIHHHRHNHHDRHHIGKQKD
jgi:hypothetical protein